LPSQGDPASSAVEEADPEIIFQCLDLKRHGGLGQEKMFCGFAKVQVFSNGTKHLEPKMF
jgi:hypothetical protein